MWCAGAHTRRPARLCMQPSGMSTCSLSMSSCAGEIMRALQHGMSSLQKLLQHYYCHLTTCPEVTAPCSESDAFATCDMRFLINCGGTRWPVARDEHRNVHNTDHGVIGPQHKTAPTQIALLIYLLHDALMATSFASKRKRACVLLC